MWAVVGLAGAVKFWILPCPWGSPYFGSERGVMVRLKLNELARWVARRDPLIYFRRMDRCPTRRYTGTYSEQLRRGAGRLSHR